MPRWLYGVATAGCLVWGWLLWRAAHWHWLLAALPQKAGPFAEFIGTLLTLVPVGVDLARKLYVARRAAPEAGRSAFAATARANLWAAFLGFEGLYALAFFVGVSAIALGFAIDLAGGD